MKKILFLVAVASLLLGNANAGLLNDSAGTAGLWQMDAIGGVNMNKVYDDDSVVIGRNNNLILSGTTLPTVAAGYEGNALVLDGVSQFGQAGLLTLTDYLAITTYVKFDMAPSTTHDEYIINAGSMFSLMRFGTGGKLGWYGGDKIRSGVVTNNVWYKIDASLARIAGTNTANASLTVTALNTGSSYTVTGVLPINWATPASVFVGRHNSGGATYLDGMIDATQIIVPEPATMVLLGAGLFGTFLKRRRS